MDAREVYTGDDVEISLWLSPIGVTVAPALSCWLDDGVAILLRETGSGGRLFTRREKDRVRVLLHLSPADLATLPKGQTLYLRVSESTGPILARRLITFIQCPTP
jgi:hypothetical protein